MYTEDSTPIPRSASLAFGSHTFSYLKLEDLVLSSFSPLACQLDAFLVNGSFIMGGLFLI